MLELTYTAWERRFVMRSELDAAFFHLYGIDRDDVNYIMETFPIVKRKGIQACGTFRTKDLILQIYDAMAEAARTGTPYQAISTHPPARVTAIAPDPYPEWSPSVTNDASASGNQQPAQQSELDVKLGMITASYAEVLDATKHQDEKIGQLLTSISFLTAATLALAALESGNFITRAFVVSPYKLPLGLIALITFLVGVAWTVMLLLTSLSTPLRVPGLARTRKADQKPITWVRNVRASQIYFYEMARVSVDQWEHKWAADTEDLKNERLRSLVRETHNLGVRTSAKYDRTTEAIALLSLSLLAFALSIIYVGIVAANPSGQQPIVLNLWQRIIIGCIFGGYVWLQTFGQIRYSRQAVDEVPSGKAKIDDRLKYWAELAYAGLLGLLIVVILEFDRSWPGLPLWIAATIVLAVGYLTALLFVSSRERASSAVFANLKKGIGVTVVAQITVAVGLVVIVIFSGVKGWYVGQLGVVSFAVLLIVGSAIMQPTRTAFRNRKEYWKGINQPENRRNTATAAPD